MDIIERVPQAERWTALNGYGSNFWLRLEFIILAMSKLEIKIIYRHLWSLQAVRVFQQGTFGIRFLYVICAAVQGNSIQTAYDVHHKGVNLA